MSKKVYRTPTRRSPRCYHENPECTYIEGKTHVKETTTDKAESRGLRPCHRCTDRSANKAGNPSICCPFCGDEVPQLSTHLPDCQESKKETTET